MSSQEPKRKFTAVEMIRGKTYRVIVEFTDYDGLTHSVGESWRFSGHNFLPYEDGFTLHIEWAGKNSVFRMQWTPQSQGEIVGNFSDFVEEL